MSLNAIHVNVMVFADSSKRAYEYMVKLVVERGEEILSINARDGVIETKTKRYQSMFASNGARGYRYTEVHVDRNLCNTDIFQNIIINKLVPPHYYAGVEQDDNYNWMDYVHYFN